MKNMREMGRRWEGDEEQEREGKDERECQREREREKIFQMIYL